MVPSVRNTSLTLKVWEGSRFQVKIMLEFLVRLFRCTTATIELECSPGSYLFGKIGGQDVIGNIVDQKLLSLPVITLDLNAEDKAARTLPAVRDVFEFP